MFEEAVYFEQLFCWVLIGMALRLTSGKSEALKKSFSFAALCGLSALFRPTAAWVAAPLAFGVFLAVTAGKTGRERYRQALPF